MMRFELGLEEPHPWRAVTSAATIGISYVAGGLIPLSPYFFLTELSPSAHGVDRRNINRASCFRVHQSALYRHPAVERRVPDRVYRRTGSHGGLPDRKTLPLILQRNINRIACLRFVWVD